MTLIRCLFTASVVAVFVLQPALAKEKATLPCSYDGEVLRDNTGRVSMFKSEEMKSRATSKRDITGTILQADIKGTAIVDVLVAPDGHVLCTKSLLGHPMIRAAVESALHGWTFSPVTSKGDRVAYVGRMEFVLCQISCGDAGIHMSIVK